MAKQKYYAIKKGIDPNNGEEVENIILTNWGMTELYIKGIKGCIFKSFFTEKEAKDYLNNDIVLIKNIKKDKNNTNTNSDKKIEHKKDTLYCYVDGSYSKKLANYAYALVCVYNGKIIHINGGVGKNKEAVSMFQVAGELKGSIMGLLFAKKNDYRKVVICYDYKGIENHATGKWKRKQPESVIYYEWMQKFFKDNNHIKVEFCKVKAHSGVEEFNDIADGIAKMALNLKTEANFLDLAIKHGLKLDFLTN